MRAAIRVLTALGIVLVTAGATTTLAQTPPSPAGGAAPAQPPAPGGRPGGPLPAPPPRAVSVLISDLRPQIRGEAVLEQTAPNVTTITFTVDGLEP